MMDEPVEDSLTSSAVDHVFFVLQKCAHRSLITCNLNAVCAVTNIIITVLNRDFGDVLQRSLQELLSRSSIGATLGTTGILARTAPIEPKINVNVSNETRLSWRSYYKLYCPYDI
jgi:hypothetical protein